MFKVKYIIQAINGYNYLQTCMDKKGMVPQLIRLEYILAETCSDWWETYFDLLSCRIAQ